MNISTHRDISKISEARHAASLLLVLIFFGNWVRANDGFYQGAGDTLIPIQNKEMRVKRERLDLTPLRNPVCYDVDIPKASLNKKGKPLDSASGRLTDPANA